MIKGLTPQLAERGKIKIGEKGDEKTSKDGKKFMLPKKLDHFVVTTMQRDAAGRLLEDKTLTARLTPEGGKLLEIPIRLLYDDLDLNFPTRLSCYKGNRCWCSGDGEAASRLTEGGNGKPAKYTAVSCPCERQDPFYTGPDKCKSLGTLQVLIDGVDRIGGVWKFRTTSWNSVNAILSSLALIKTITGGILAGIPLHLVLSPKTVTVPTTGQNMVVFVVSIEYRGPESQLAQIGYELAKRRVEHKLRMEHIEDTARKQLMAPHQEPPIEQAETAQEFFPEGAVIIDATPEVVAPSQVIPEQVYTIPAEPSHLPPQDSDGLALATGSPLLCDYHPEAPATWRDEQGFNRCEGCEEAVKEIAPEVIPAQAQAKAPKGKGAGVALF